MAGLGRRLAWHIQAAWRLSWGAVTASGVIGVLVRMVLPVQDGWVAAAVAAGSGLLAIAILALAEARTPPATHALPRDPVAALEGLGTADRLAHALARAAMVLGSFAAGVALGGVLGLRP